MFSQLWHTGRSSHVETTGGKTPVSASVNPSYWKDDSHLVSTLSGWIKPSPHRALDIAEIPGIIEDYRKPLSERRRRNSKASNYMPRMAT
jgi:N-ethylmaleimide reductase